MPSSFWPCEINYLKVYIHYKNKNHQLDFITPGSIPCEARSRKQIRQIPNFLKKPLGLPQIGHLLYARTLNFGFLIAFILRAVFAKLSSLIPEWHA
jgi:hypothetical protein